MPADSQGDEFRKILAVYNNEIATAGKLGLTSASKRAENVCMRLLNALYGWSLVNANSPAENAEAIDLIDEKNHLVIQVTTTCSADKINHTLKSDKTNEYHQEGYRLKFAFVGFQHDATKVQGEYGWTIHDPHCIGFNRKEDTLFTADLVDQFEQLGPDKREEILQLVHGDIGRIVSPTPAHAFVDPDIIERINTRLIRQRENHPSFQLMRDDYDAALQPQGTTRDDGRTIPNEQRLVKTEGGAETSFRNFVRDSWESGEQNHLFIIGRGGLGKTVALLTFATEEGFLPKGVPAVYIPLYDLSQYADSKRECVDRYLKSAFSEDEYDTVERLSHDPWCNGPNVILLLDGYNEIPSDKIQDVNGGIRAWAERPGVQMVTTSRIPGLFGISRTQWLELQPLSEHEVKGHLKKRDLPVPKDAALMRVLETPLMLKLYIDVESFSNQATANYLQMELSDSAGRLIWNYLQRELWQVVDLHKGDYSKIEYAAAILLTLPYVCWRMESAHEFSIEVDTLNEYIQDACDYWLGQKQSSRFGTVEVCLRQRLNSVDGDGLFFSQLAILENEAGLFVLGAGGYTLMHQSLRDGLAAIHLRNVMEAAGNDGIPEEFGKPISEYVKDLFAELCDATPDETNPLLRLWECARKADEGRTGLTNPALTHNLLRVIHKRFGGDLTMLDWSGMDLRGESLFPYRMFTQSLGLIDGSLNPFQPSDGLLALSLKPEHFVHTIIDARCFKPQSLETPVDCLCFSPDGLLLAGSSHNGGAMLWDSATGRLVKELAGCDGNMATSVCFSPDGSLVAAGLHDGAVLLWSTASGQLVREVERCDDDLVTSVCFSPDGSLIATGSHGGAVRMWEIVSGRLLWELGTNTSPQVRRRYEGVTFVRFSPDGSLIARCSHMEGVSLWNAATGQLLRRLGEYWSQTASVAFSPDGSLVAAGPRRGSLQLWDTASGRLVRELKGSDDVIASSVCFSPDGSLIASCSYIGGVHLWDASTGRAVRRFKGSEIGNSTACFSPDGTLVAVGNFGGGVQLWDAAAGRLVRELVGSLRNQATSLCFSPDGSLVAASSFGGAVFLWDSTTSWLKQRLKVGDDEADDICFSPNGSLVAVGSRDGGVQLWSATTAQMIWKHAERGIRASTVCFSPDGKLVAAGLDNGTVRLWDAATGGFVRGIAGRGGKVATMCFSPDGMVVAVGSRNGAVRLWNSVTGEFVQGFAGSGNGATSIRFSPDGPLVEASLSGGTVRQWDIYTGRLARELEWNNGEIATSTCLSPDGSHVAIGTLDGTVQLRSISTGELIRELKRSGDNHLFHASFSPDNLRIAVDSPDGTVELWDIREDTAENIDRGIGFTGRIEPLYDVDVSGLDVSLAIIENDHDRQVLRQNGVVA